MGRGQEVSVYIHAKLLLVDDRFLTIGSANIANRSMGFDSELNVSWEAVSRSQLQLSHSIHQARVNLLAEHTGLPMPRHRRKLGRVRGLVDNLNRLADNQSCRLHHHKMENSYHDSELLESLNLNDLVFDPEKPTLEENIYELISYDQNSLFARGITFLRNWLHTDKGKNPVNRTQEDKILLKDKHLSHIINWGYPLDSRYHYILWYIGSRLPL